MTVDQNDVTAPPPKAADGSASGLEISLLLEAETNLLDGSALAGAAPLELTGNRPAASGPDDVAMTEPLAALDLLDLLLSASDSELPGPEPTSPPSRPTTEVVYDGSDSLGMGSGFEAVGIIFGAEPETPV